MLSHLSAVNERRSEHSSILSRDEANALFVAVVAHTQLRREACLAKTHHRVTIKKR